MEVPTEGREGKGVGTPEKPTAFGRAGTVKGKRPSGGEGRKEEEGEGSGESGPHPLRRRSGGSPEGGGGQSPVGPATPGKGPAHQPRPPAPGREPVSARRDPGPARPANPRLTGGGVG